MTHTDSLLQSRPLSVLAWGQKCVQSEDQQGELQGSPGQYYRKNHSLGMGLITDLICAKVTCVGLGNAYT